MTSDGPGRPPWVTLDCAAHRCRDCSGESTVPGALLLCAHPCHDAPAPVHGPRAGRLVEWPIP